MVASPTLSLESLFTTLVIYAYKGRDVATFDVTELYLHSKMPNEKSVIMNLQGGGGGVVYNVWCESRAQI